MRSAIKFAARAAAGTAAVLLLSACVQKEIPDAQTSVSEEIVSQSEAVPAMVPVSETEPTSAMPETETSLEAVSETTETSQESDSWTISERVIVPKLEWDSLDWDKDFMENTIFVGDSVCRALYVYNDLLTTKQVAATGGGAARNIYDYTFKMEDHEFTLKEAAEYYKPDIFFLWMGINDINMTEKDVYANNLKNIAEDMLSISPESRVVILSMSPTADYHEWKANARIRDYNAAAREMCESITDEEIYYLDIQDILSDSDGYLLPECDSGDGLHLSQMAYTRLLSYITNALDSDFFSSSQTETETAAPAAVNETVENITADTAASADTAKTEKNEEIYDEEIFLD